MQVAVLFTVRWLWGNGIELLSCQSPVLLLLDWLLRLPSSTLKPQRLGKQPQGSASITATKLHSSHGDAGWRERKDSAGQRDEHLITMLLSPCAFNLWLPHWFEGCGSCVSRRNRDAGPALQKPLAGWCGNGMSASWPEQGSAQGPRAPPATNTKSGTTLVPQEPRTLVPWCFPSELSCQPELSRLFFPIYFGKDSQRLPELPFLPGSSLFERGIYLERQWGCALYCPLYFKSPPIVQALTNSCP